MAFSTSKILDAAANMVAKLQTKFPCDHLDIGPGRGDLISLMREKFNVRSSACDYTDEFMELHDVQVKIANLNNEGLPYDDGSFDLVTATEVIEHLEHYRGTLREIYRVLRPDGTLVITTPNILNMRSRVRFLIVGFYNLFGPLHVRDTRLHTTGGHINPVSCFYLTHALLDAGFSQIALSIDKKQRTSWLYLIPLILPIRLLSKHAWSKERRKYNTMDEHNEKFVYQMNSLDILLGRTIVVGCKKTIHDVR